MGKAIDQIETSDFLSSKEIELIGQGYGYMVEDGYSKLDGVRDVLRVIAVRIEYARRNRQISKMNGFGQKEWDRVTLLIDCELAGLRNLAARTGIV